ncbi:MAG: bifunctional pyr operon transcriptional regulator/uracil phosphoribosyltransferase [Elusimicrobia bacterium RIFOXYC2_FULL_34_12]|nr:MAG: bifunctional pyr operon transcriptional regulator/uracil phosphoribosyltransferase [Elusimicrobia bacterium RIFOXYC2_FULL_34_12]
MKSTPQKVIVNSNEMSITLRRLAHEIIEKLHGVNNLVFIGIQTRGVFIAKRIVSLIESITKKTISFGTLDITLYRDDVDRISKQPIVKETEIPFDITGKDIILVDDVLFTGRTIRAAMDELIDFGRPKTIKLAVFIDRGCRELPIQPDFIGLSYPITKKDVISVNLKETDGKDNVVVYKKGD